MAAVENMKPVMSIARISRAMNVPRSTIYRESQVQMKTAISYKLLEVRKIRS